MSTVTNYNNARAIFTKVRDEISSTKEPMIIKRRRAQDVSLVTLVELSGVMNTAHLFTLPMYVERLLQSMARAQTQDMNISSVETLRKEKVFEQSEIN